MRKKGATSLSILLLVVATLVLVGFALFTFLTQRIEISSFLYQSFEDVYAKEAEINFYLSHGWSLGEIGNLELKEDKYYKSQLWSEDIILKKFFTDIEVDEAGKKITVTKLYYKDETENKPLMKVVYKFDINK